MSENLIRYYIDLLNGETIKDNRVYLESHGGSDLGGNLYYLAREFLTNAYYELNIVLNDQKCIPNNVRLLQKVFGTDVVNTILKDSREQIYCLATAKYLITDVQFSPIYRKRNGQICVQTWHGTPLKKLGYDFYDDVAWTGGQKKAFIDADIVLYPNRYTQKHMKESYRLDYYSNNDFIAGYPRNAIFFDREHTKEVRKKEKNVHKKTYAYMPTWRGSINNRTDSHTELMTLLDQLERTLNDNEVFYVKLHRLMREKINLLDYYHIKEFPEEYEPYEFLSSVDCLITDYSSVMIDYLCTGNKVILYMYDKEDYLNQQGMYLDIDKLPFAQVYSVEDLIAEMRKENMGEYKNVYERFCGNENINAANELFLKIIEKGNIKEKKFDNTDKRHYLFYGGDLSPTTHTIRFVEMIDSVSCNDNYYVSVAYKNVDFLNEPLRLQVFQRPIDLISIDYYKGDIFYDSNNCVNSEMWSYAYEWQFHGISIDKIVCYIDHYDDAVELLSSADCDVTFLLDETMDLREKQMVIDLARRKKVAIANEISRVIM